MSNLCGLCMEIDSYRVALLNAVILTPSRLERKISVIFLRFKFEFLTTNPKSIVFFSEKIEASEFDPPKPNKYGFDDSIAMS